MTVEGGPERLYTPSDEVAQAQAKLPELERDYYNPPPGVDPKKYWGSDAQKWYRNEYIARRMYIIDVEYSAYEAALTAERQKYAFGTDVAALALGTAGALTPPGVTARALSLTSTALSATTGYYDKDLIIAKTIQIVEANMRAQRLTVSITILQRRNEPTTTYPLAAALSDLEQYYLAGTMNTGLIMASTDAGNNEAGAALDKALTVTYGSSASTIAFMNCFTRPGVGTAAIMKLMPNLGQAALAKLSFDTSAAGDGTRAAILTKAKAAGLCP